jgi:hypothetical protein
MRVTVFWDVTVHRLTSGGFRHCGSRIRCVGGKQFGQ